MDMAVKNGPAEAATSSMGLTKENPREQSKAGDNAITVISGFGCGHTNEYGTMPYTEITWDEVCRMAASPQEQGKDAQWLIPSSLHSRTFKEQELNGSYSMLWGDLDEDAPEFERLVDILDDLGCEFLVYSSRSATVQNQKARIIIPLSQPLSGVDWMLCAESFNDWLMEQGIAPDRASERTAQLCYLPNRGEFYKSHHEDLEPLFDPLVYFSAHIKGKRLQAQLIEADRIARQAEAKRKRQERKASGFDSPIDEFNQAYEVSELLEQAGYDLKGTKFRHPNSQSGSYSGNIKDSRAHALSSSDPLFTNGGGAHDAFSCFEILFHGSDRSAALKDAGDNWLTLGGESWNKVKQREYAQQKSAANVDDFQQVGKELSPLEKIRQMSICDQAQDILKSLDEDVFLLERLVLMNQITIFFAPPNSGKTLLTVHFLIEAAERGDIDPRKVVYVNADDTPRGAATKADLLRGYGINMLVPGHNGFESGKLYPMLEALIKADQATGTIVVLDTLRRFFNSMDHDSTKEFGEISRRFISAGGTMLVLGHTNKNKSEAGKNKYEGTQGTVNDADAVYVLDVKSSLPTDGIMANNSQTYVTFEASVEVGGKLRGDNDISASYSFKRYANQSYEELLGTIEKITSSDSELTEVQRSAQQSVESIAYIEHLIKEGTNKRTELIKAIYDGCELSRAKAARLLDLHTGERWSNGYRWKVKQGDSKAPAAKLYELLQFHQGGE